MITVFVGDVTEYLSDQAHEMDQSATLLTTHTDLNLTSGTYYTSLGDFSDYKSFVDALELADVLIYAPPTQWSDCNSRGFSFMQQWTEHCLFYFNDKKTVVGLQLNTVDNLSIILNLEDTRKTSDCQLWIVGGSDTHGIGVGQGQRYGQLLANRLSVSASFLTKPKSSIEWAADQILRSDLRTGDAVIWGLVPPSRFPFYNGQEVIHVGLSHFEQFPDFVNQVEIDQLLNLNTLLYRPIVSIAKVQNVCTKLGVDLLLVGLDSKSEYSVFMKDCKNYIHLANRFGFSQDRFLDFGQDNMHPGTKMHEWYADKILNRMISLGFDIVVK